MGVDARLNEYMALYLCMSSHVHVCGAYICLPEAGVLNSLSMCDESSGWEKEQRVAWPLSVSHKLNSKEAIDLSGSQMVFCSAPVSLSHLSGFTFPSLCFPLCLAFHLLLYFFLSLNRRDAECGREMQQVCETDKKERASPTRTSFILIRSLCPRKGLLFTCLP